MVCGATANRQHIISREHFGVLFKPSGKGAISGINNVLLTVRLKVPTLHANPCLHQPNTNLSKLSETLMHSYRSIRGSLYGRTKRTDPLAPFIGKLSEILFGTATTERLDKLESDLVIMESNLDESHGYAAVSYTHLTLPTICSV